MKYTFLPKNMHIKYQYVTILVFFTLFFDLKQLNAQNSTEYASILNLFQEKNYDLVINKSKEYLLNNSNLTVEVANIHFMMTLSYYQKQKYLDANFASFQFINKYPKEDKLLQAAFYIKACSQLMNQNWQDAFLYFDKISERQWKERSTAFQFTFFNKLNSDSLSKIKTEFPKEKIWKKLEKKNDELGESKPQNPSSWNIGILLPFENSPRNHFVIEFYNGLTLALDSLNKSTPRFKKCFFESGKDSIAINSFLSNPQSRNLDLIIGPLYASQTKQVAEFGEQNKIAVINPLSYNVFVDTLKKNYFQFFPNFKSIGTESAKFSAQNFTRKNTVVIFFSQTLSDSLVAYSYKNTFENLGGRVLSIRSLSKNNSIYAQQVLKKVVIDSVGHVLVASAEPALAANIFSAMESLLIEKAASYKETLIEKLKEEQPIEEEKKISVADIPVIVPFEWLDFETIGYDQFALHNTHFIYSKFIDPRKNIKKFEALYMSRFGNKPTYFSHIGYNLMLYFGDQLDQYGKLFYLNPEMGQLKSLPTMGFINYNSNKINTFIPIVKIQDFELLLVNEPQQSPLEIK